MFLTYPLDFQIFVFCSVYLTGIFSKGERLGIAEAEFLQAKFPFLSPNQQCRSSETIGNFYFSLCLVSCCVY